MFVLRSYHEYTSELLDSVLGTHGSILCEVSSIIYQTHPEVTTLQKHCFTMKKSGLDLASVSEKVWHRHQS